MKKTLILFCLFMPFLAFGSTKSMTKVPTGWKMENYFGDSLVVFFSGSTCKNGRLTFPSHATVHDKNRFWSLILSAKATKSKVFVIYKDDALCTLVSFATVG